MFHNKTIICLNYLNLNGEITTIYFSKHNFNYLHLANFQINFHSNMLLAGTNSHNLWMSITIRKQ